MTDAFKQDLLNTDYVGGEMPDAYKLTASTQQLKTAVERLNQAVGDIHNQQSNVGNNPAAHEYNLSSPPTAGPNLSRHLGSVGWMNSRDVGRVRSTDVEVVFVGHQDTAGTPPVYWGWNHYNRRQFRLPFPPVYFASASSIVPLPSYADVTKWAIASPDVPPHTDATVAGSGKVVTRVTDLADLNNAGEYHVSPDGIITLYQPLDSNEGFKVTYTFDSLPEFSLDSTWCVIPDFSEITNLCTVALFVGTTYNITLPTVDSAYGITLGHTGRNDTPVMTHHSSMMSEMYGYQCVLPKILTDNLKSGDTIPAGYIQLFDSAARGGLGQVLSGGSWIYISSTQVQVVGLSLTAGSNRYRVVVPGHNVTEALAKLARAYNDHDHSGDWNDDDGHHGKRLSHVYLLNQVDEGGLAGATTLEGFTESSLGPARNPHPQYLHRYGYYYQGALADGSATAGNRHNALLGDLCLSDENGDIGVVNASFRVRFGSSAGPTIHYTGTGAGSDERLSVTGADLALVTASKQYKYASSRTYYKTVGPECGVAQTYTGGADIVGWHFVPNPGASPYASCRKDTNEIDFPIHLPSLATAVAVEAAVSQIAANPAQITVTLYRHAIDWTLPSIADAPAPMGAGTSSNPGDQTVTIAVDPALAEIDNMTYRYFVRVVGATGAAAPNGDRVYGIRVRCTLTEVHVM